MKKIMIVIIIIFVGLTSWWAINYFALLESPLNPQSPRVIKDSASVEGTDDGLTTGIPDYRLQIVAEDLYVPWGIVFTSQDRMLVSERNGYIREVIDWELNPEPLYYFQDVFSRSEAGLMGIELHPNYSQNNLVYACLATQHQGQNINQVVTLIDNTTELVFGEVVINDIPTSRIHAGCRIRFGPDDKLYITTGDAGEKDLAQELDSLAGKILRLNQDGSIPEDNPFPNSPVYSLGHRNPQGLDWHPVTDYLYSTEHGPSIFDGPAGGDEFNRIMPGENYGWPLVSHDDNLPGLIPPIIQFTPAEAPASGMFYTGELFPEFRLNFFFGALRGEGIVRLILDPDDPDSLIEVQKLPDIDVGRIRDIVQGQDGIIYFTTSNRDGRGSLRDGDDKIYAITP